MPRPEIKKRPVATPEKCCRVCFYQGWSGLDSVCRHPKHGIRILKNSLAKCDLFISYMKKIPVGGKQSWEDRLSVKEPDQNKASRRDPRV